MPIYRTALTSNFTQISNDLLASPLPPVPSKVLNYLLSKPSNWQMQRTDLKKTLALTGYAIQKALKWLQLNGYAWFTRFCGKTTWRFTDNPNSVSTKPINQVTPTSPVIAESIEIQHVENQHVLTIIEKQTNKETQLPAPVAVAQKSIVVVDELIYPVQLNPSQKKACKSVIKKVKQPELQQPVLFALAYAMAQHKINSIPAYLQGLVKRANDGTFEATQADSNINTNKPLIPIWQGFGQSNPSNPDKAKSFIQQAKSALKGVAPVLI